MKNVVETILAEEHELWKNFARTNNNSYNQNVLAPHWLQVLN